ncbi:MAG: FAD-dependent oxidoreductase [Clostridia bacterium]|jgi:glycine/D-amino acid oxidase-like deaminating enzyme/nitrite reductase/ring-hydroxylating ferredoxin subunit|nr:FAD-dependent oxidoreductase [Clostridia bacterium]
MSLWLDTCKLPEYDALDKDIECDVLIMGGGLSGILTAFLLKQKGVDACIVESDRIASGTTGRTTGKVTIQHGLCYHNFLNQIGREKTLMYKIANDEALKTYRYIVDKLNIECDFETKPAYVYTTEPKYAEAIKEEAEVAKDLGIDAEYIEGKLPLPFPTECAVKFNNQAQFHPLKFISSIIQGLKIYEKTKVLEIDVEKHVARTTGGKIKARHIVFATGFPFNYTPGYYFLRMHQKRSYLLALEIQSDSPQLDGMYLDANGENGFTLRMYNGMLLFGGGSHRTGENSGGKYDYLIQSANKYYPGCRIVHQWSAQDCVSLDNIPYIGQFSASTPNIFVTTGYRKWGMTGSMVGAKIVADMILGQNDTENYREVFNPQRFNLSASAVNLFKDTVKAVKGLAKEKFTIPKEELKEVNSGEGKVIEYLGKKVGVYRDDEGTVYTVSTKCSHLGCQLEWNQDEKSWDCPCHGSRFDYKGFVIDNPAIHPVNFLDD